MLKEYLIGTEVYDRKPPYQPSADSIVREARRLRSKLKEYYESVGKDDPVFIYYRPRGYVPAFRHQRSLRDDRIATERALGELFTEELSAQALDIPLVAGKLDVQIVFEGTPCACYVQVQDHQRQRISDLVKTVRNGIRYAKSCQCLSENRIDTDQPHPFRSLCLLEKGTPLLRIPAGDRCRKCIKG